jgi:hypothetical protein
LGAGLDERQDWPAVRVEVTGGGVTVTSASGETEAGSHVVVTVPLGVLKNDLPAFGHPFRPSEPRSYADSASAATRRLP